MKERLAMSALRIMLNPILYRANEAPARWLQEL
jgi:hypothetical protein